MSNSAFAGVRALVDNSLHFPLPSINRLNETEPATFAVLLFWAFFMGFLFCILHWR